jgi:hypothetical protein
MAICHSEDNAMAICHSEDNALLSEEPASSVREPKQVPRLRLGMTEQMLGMTTISAIVDCTQLPMCAVSARVEDIV